LATLPETIAELKSALSVSKAAKLLGCDAKTIYRLIYRNSIPYFKVGSMYRLDPALLAAWLREQSVIPHGMVIR
jgi:excisionase family DNA binding protein